MPELAASARGAVRPATLAPGVSLALRRLALVAFGVLVLSAACSQVLIRGHSGTLPTTRHGSVKHDLLSLPLAAQGPVSAALGANNPAYRITVSDGGFQATNPAQHLKESFGHSGVHVSSGKVQLGLRVRAVGYGTSLRQLGDAIPRVKTNRVTYVRGDLREWYVDGPLGLEQGFTLSRAPAGGSAGPLTVSMALSTTAHLSLASNGRSLTVGYRGGSSLRYGGLVTIDARGRALRSWLELRHRGLLLRVDTRGARYPLRIDPFVQQGPKLTGGGEIGEGQFGGFGYSPSTSAVALSSDGNTALIGAPADNGSVGAAWVFTRSGSTWTQQGEKLTGRGVIGGLGFVKFGISVALSSDGNTALIGGSPNAGARGVAWVFTRSGSTWTQQGEPFTAADETTNDTSFGHSVALSSDGNTALIGGFDDNEFVGAAWVFTRSGSTWTQQGPKLTGSGENPPEPGGAAGSSFGESVALSSDGNTALIGGYLDNTFRGAVWVFTRSGSSWTQQGAKLTGGGEVGRGEFGESVALSADGNTALIGGPGDADYVGAAWVFTRSDSTWTQLGEKLTGGGEVVPTGKFGESVALSSDGNVALIGGPLDTNGIGAAWVFRRSGPTWTQQDEKLTGGGEVWLGIFGQSVALSSAGTTALIAGPVDNFFTGAAWVFVPATKTSTSLAGGPQSGAAITVPEGTAVVDGASLTGENAATATGTVTYKVYSDSKCEQEVASAGSASVSAGKVSVSEAKTLAPGTYFWQASYGGDASNGESTSECGDEVLTVTPSATGAAPLTVGYWKTHLTRGTPNTKQYLPQSIGSYAVATTEKASAIFTAMNCSNASSSSQNAIACLAGQLLATELNLANGSPKCVAALVAKANSWLLGDSEDGVPGVVYAGPYASYTVTSAQRNEAIAFKDPLDRYNNGGGC
jgi:hypothetical protein